MRHENVTTAERSKIDFKGIGYIVSIASVFLLGAIAWPTAGEPEWHKVALILGMAASIVGMGLRYLAHLQQQRELKQAKRTSSPA